MPQRASPVGCPVGQVSCRLRERRQRNCRAAPAAHLTGRAPARAGARHRSRKRRGQRPRRGGTHRGRGAARHARRRRLRSAPTCGHHRCGNVSFEARDSALLPGAAVDFGGARDWLARYNAGVPVAERLLEAVLLVKAVARAVSEIEGFNGSLPGRTVPSVRSVHVGAAIAMRGGGLVAPALLDANLKPI